MPSELLEISQLIALDPTYIRQRNDGLFTKYDRIYPFTTESIKYYMDDLTDKDVLAVAASGDHAIESFYHGANSVDTFDINLLTNYYQELKIEAMKRLSYEEFFKLFTDEGYGINDDEALKIYEKVRPYLNDKTQYLFDYILNKYIFDNDLLNINLFFATSPKDQYDIRLNYFDIDSYYEHQKSLQGKDVNFINTDIINLDKRLNKKYDVMFLSNISSYITDINVMINILKRLKKHLTENGTIYFSYIYGDDDFELDNKYYSLKNVSYDTVPCARDYESVDKVYKLKKIS